MLTLFLIYWIFFRGRDANKNGDIVFEDIDISKYPDLAGKSPEDQKIIATYRQEEEQHRNKFKRRMIFAGIILLVNGELFIYTHSFYPIVVIFTIGFTLVAALTFFTPKEYR